MIDCTLLFTKEELAGQQAFFQIFCPSRHKQPKMNREVAKDLLLNTYRLLDDCGITSFLIWGTLLGIYREGNLIEWDCDVDIGMLEEDFSKLEIFTKEKKIESLGFSFCRAERDVLSIHHSGEYLDIYIFEKNKEILFWRKFPYHSSKILPLKEILFQETTLRIPAEPEFILEDCYGQDWRTPKQGGYYSRP